MRLVHFQQPGLPFDTNPNGAAECGAQHSPSEEYAAAFKAWAEDDVATANVRLDSSVAQYEVLWQSLMKFAVGQVTPVRMSDLTPQDLQAFIEARRQLTASAKATQRAAPRYVWRLLTVIDRVLHHHAIRTNTPHNSAALRLLKSNPEWEYANAGQRDHLPPHLSPMDASTLVAYLSQSRPRPGKPSVVDSWQDLRNRASVALQLGAGITPAEVRALKVADAIISGGRLAGVPWKLRVPADPTTPERETPIAPWAGQLLAHWLTMRQQAGIQGDFLFPSVRSGKAWSKLSQYGAVASVLAGTTIDPALHTGGSFRLRHTFALRQLRKRVAPAQVALWLGVSDPAVMARYQKVVFTPPSEIY
jgi:integrase